MKPTSCRGGSPAAGVRDVQVTAKVSNVGNRAGADVAQLHLGDPVACTAGSILGNRDSNPNFDVQSVACCHYTIPQGFGRLLVIRRRV